MNNVLLNTIAVGQRRRKWTERERNCEEDIKKLIIQTQKRGRLRNNKKNC